VKVRFIFPQSLLLPEVPLFEPIHVIWLETVETSQRPAMLRVYNRIVSEHDLRLVALAASVRALESVVAVNLLDWVRRSEGNWYGTWLGIALRLRGRNGRAGFGGHFPRRVSQPYYRAHCAEPAVCRKGSALCAVCRRHDCAGGHHNRHQHSAAVLAEANLLGIGSIVPRALRTQIT
jgi:hypothetical protein